MFAGGNPNQPNWYAEKPIAVAAHEPANSTAGTSQTFFDDLLLRLLNARETTGSVVGAGRSSFERLALSNAPTALVKD